MNKTIKDILKTIIAFFGVLFFSFFFHQDVKAGPLDNASGWAWVGNDTSGSGIPSIGWISFNCTNREAATGKTCLDANDPAFNPAINLVDYGVTVDPVTGYFSGYAWSDQIGWISFNRSDTGVPPNSPIDDACPVGGCIAKLELSGPYQVNGWARACGGSPIQCGGDGWDGWIKLRGSTVPFQDGAVEGVAISDPNSAEEEEIYSSAVDSKYLYTGGYDLAVPGDESQWRIEKRNKTTGKLCNNIVNCPDGLFDTDGVINENFTSGYDIIWSIDVDDNYLYAAGDESVGGQWRIEKRNKTTGALCDGVANCVAGAFDGDGVIIVDPTTNIDQPLNIVVDSDYLYVAGTQQERDTWRIEKRNKTTGALCDGVANCVAGAFDGDGVIILNVCTNCALGELYYGKQFKPVAITIDSSNVYLTGFDGLLGNTNLRWRIEKRDIASGALIPAFDGDGVITEDVTSVNDEPNVITADPNYLYITGHQNEHGEWRVEKRDKNTGALCGNSGNCGGIEFGAGGVITEILSPGWDEPLTIVLDPDFSTFYLSGDADGEWRVEKRYSDSGSLNIAAEYGVSLNPSPSPNELLGWAWGGDDSLDEAVVGWVSFNCADRGACGTSNYKVTVSLNQPPDPASNLTVQDFTSDYCSNSPVQRFSWVFSDLEDGPNQTAYWLQVDNDSNFLSPEFDSGKTASAVHDGIPVPVRQSPGPNELSYNTSYFWRVQVYDSGDSGSGWAVYQNNIGPAESFQTPLHRYPSPLYNFINRIYSVGEVIAFSDNSVCYNILNNPYSCAIGPNTYLWNFGDLNPSTVVGSTTHSYSVTGKYSVNLSVNDPSLSAGQCSWVNSLQVKVGIPLPRWKEIPPF